MRTVNRDTRVTKILRPFQEFAQLEASSGILLLGCTILALFWANSSWSQSYFDFWNTRFSVALGAFALSKPLLLWINDGLMAIFFFVVGLEIKRELLEGELASPRQAAVPLAAAVGGMAIPATIYVVINAGSPGVSGWAIPSATDIAFALGVLALLGKRIPIALKVFLTALAIVDDLGAVVVIALFYTAKISWFALSVGFALLLFLFALSRGGVRNLIVYIVFGILIWVAFLKSGVHATIAGVLVALTIPARSIINADLFLSNSRSILSEVEESKKQMGHISRERQQAAVLALEETCEDAESVLTRLEHALHPWVGFLIMPIFALANAGVTLSEGFVRALYHPTGLGVVLGLFVGKQLGILSFSWLAVRLGFGSVPAGVSWKQLYGAALLGGIGFTMSLFIAGLAFGESDLLNVAKIGILAGSLISGICGWLILRSTSSSITDR